MDKLNNIHRIGGYPLVAESLQILQDHENAITAIMDALNIPFETCVILQYKNTSSGVLIEALVYVVNKIALNTNTSGVIVRLHGDGTTRLASLLSGATSKSITIVDTPHTVTDGVSPYPDAYITQVANLTPISGNIIPYRFTYISDIFSRNRINGATILNVNAQASFQLIWSSVSQSKILVEKKKIIFDLHLDRDIIADANPYCYYRIYLSSLIPIPAGVHALKCSIITYIMPISDNNVDVSTIPCAIYNGAIQFQIPSDSLSAAQNSDIIHITGTILI